MGFVTEIIPALKSFRIIGDVEAFKKWMQNTHPEKSVDDIFEGYRFALICCLNTFIEYMEFENELNFQISSRTRIASSYGFEFDKLSHDCEFVVLLKNIQPYYKALRRARDYSALGDNIEHFNQLVTDKIQWVFEQQFVFTSSTNHTRESAEEALHIYWMFLFLIQVKGNGPIANATHLLNPKWTKREYLIRCLEGYKYAIQFLWYSVLGEKKYEDTRLPALHQVESWNTYIYINEPENGDALAYLTAQFNLEKQTSLDSYFYWVQTELIHPLERQYKNIRKIEELFVFNSTGYNKRIIFKDVLQTTSLKVPESLNRKEEIELFLDCRPVEIVDAHKSEVFMGIPSFDIMLRGAVASFEKDGSDDRIEIVKFIHLNQNKYTEYSYGILIDGRGWVIYKNACGSYSGEYQSMEEQIVKYLDEEKVNYKELIVPLIEFEEYVDTLEGQLVMLKREVDRLRKQLQISRSYLFELFVHQLCEKWYRPQGYIIKPNHGQKTDEGEIDILMERETDVILVECKLNPQSNDMTEMVRKAERKLQKYNKKEKYCQFWFWEELSEKNKAGLEAIRLFGKPVDFVEVRVRRDDRLRGISLHLLEKIMDDRDR